MFNFLDLFAEGLLLQLGGITFEQFFVVCIAALVFVHLREQYLFQSLLSDFSRIGILLPGPWVDGIAAGFIIERDWS